MHGAPYRGYGYVPLRFGGGGGGGGGGEGGGGGGGGTSLGKWEHNDNNNNYANTLWNLIFVNRHWP